MMMSLIGKLIFLLSKKNTNFNQNKTIMKLTAADQKFINTHITPNINEWVKGVSNPFSGETFPASPLIATLVQMVQDLSYTEFSTTSLNKWGCTKGNAVQKFDRARYIVLKLDSKLYMSILD